MSGVVAVVRFDPSPSEVDPRIAVDRDRTQGDASLPAYRGADREALAAGLSRRYGWRAVAWAAGLHGALNLVLKGIEVRVDEPPALRWLRLVDEHPVRCTLATALLLVAVELALQARRSSPWIDASSTTPHATAAGNESGGACVPPSVAPE